MGCKSASLFVMKVLIFMTVSMYVKLSEIFPMDVVHNCNHPPLGGNNSGMKVMIAGLAKSGTTSTSHALNALGIRSYHSEDWRHFVWNPLFFGDEHPEVQGDARRQHKMMMAMPHEELATRLSKCRPEAMAFDGIGALWPKIRAVSPGVKVVMLNWRTFSQWNASATVFGNRLWASMWFNRFLTSSPNMLPFWRPLFHAFDELIGSPVKGLAETGGPPVSYDASHPMVFFYMFSSANRLQAKWLFEDVEEMNTPTPVYTEEEFTKYYQDIKDQTPPEDLLEFNPKKSTYEDLCNFLNVSPCPRSGTIENRQIIFRMPLDHPKTYLGLMPVFGLIHVVNWYLIKGVFSIVMGLFTSVTGVGAAASSKKKA